MFLLLPAPNVLCCLPFHRAPSSLKELGALSIHTSSPSLLSDPESHHGLGEVPSFFLMSSVTLNPHPTRQYSRVLRPKALHSLHSEIYVKSRESLGKMSTGTSGQQRGQWHTLLLGLLGVVVGGQWKHKRKTSGGFHKCK